VQTLAGEETDRANRNADYQWLLSSLATLDNVRKEKTLSLNLKKRQLERQTQDQERLQQENSRRAADALPPLKSIEDIVISEEPDVILTQASDIMADAVAASESARNAPAVAQQQPGAPGAPANHN
jgi:hypothetical protein